MTAEVAVLNSTGVALAADSDVTISDGRGQKVYQSANKLFSLSKYVPVATMFHGRAALMGVHWELLVKVYRDQLGESSFDTLSEHAMHFLKWIQERTDLFTEDVQSNHVFASVQAEYQSLAQTLEQAIKQRHPGGGRIPESEARSVTRNVVSVRKSELSQNQSLKSVDGRALSISLTDRYLPLIERAMNTVFSDFARFVDHAEVIAIGQLSLTKQLDSDAGGVVVAGYGKTEYFPSLMEFLVDGVFSDTIRFQEKRSRHIRGANDASIEVFAQSAAIVHAFMQGVDRKYQAWIEWNLRTTIDAIISEIEKKCGPQNLNSTEMIETIVGRMGEYRQNQFTGPIMNILAKLPHTELAAMAETLVSLTSFHQRLTPGVETVGGPIDVAVVSRGDGFVWLKRKHYFNPALNHHFFDNYFRRYR